jgi:hypothetical protein
MKLASIRRVCAKHLASGPLQFEHLADLALLMGLKSCCMRGTNKPV